MEPNLANPDDVENFIHGLARLFIAEYMDDLGPNEYGYFTRHRGINTDVAEVVSEFFDNWRHYLPSKYKILQIQNKTIGICRHVHSYILTYDDQFQIRVCKKIGQIFTEFMSRSDASVMQLEEEMDTSGPPANQLTFECQIHSSHPIVPHLEQFMKEFSERMFGNFLHGIPFQRKKALYLAAEIDSNATMGDDYHHLSYEVSPLWSYLLPTPCQILPLIHNIYRFKYHHLEKHIIPHDIGFKHRVSMRLTDKIRRYLLQHADVFKPTT